MFRLIFVHEMFHFVWARLSSSRRNEFRELLLTELKAKTRGELGDSAARKKQDLSLDDARLNTHPWRDYTCESFCDTAAWVYAGVAKHEAFRLAQRWRRRRAAWFKATFQGCCLC
jgi:hypothetical protein